MIVTEGYWGCGRRRTLWRTSVEERGRHGLCLWYDVPTPCFRRKLSLSLVTVPLTLSVFLESILHRNLFADKVLPVQVVNRRVARIEVSEADESESFARPGIVPGNLW